MKPTQKQTKQKQTKQTPTQIDECSGCSLAFWRCTECKNKFEPGDKTYCIREGEQHLCEHCFLEKSFDGEDD
jgi:NAD-dependent SIR2 family protein deacetylase